MNQKSAGVPRTWHSLWDEMFSGFTAREISLSAELECPTCASALAVCACDQLEVIGTRGAADAAANDNGTRR
jgi:hypothetical protein